MGKAFGIAGPGQVEVQPHLLDQAKQMSFAASFQHKMSHAHWKQN